MSTFPIVLTSAGYLPQTPTALQTALINNVTATNPGYTANLPGSLIEDISSTDVYALLQCDSSVAEIINSLTPYGANAFLLNQLGSIYGVQLGLATNTSVYVVFSGPAGFVINQGFTVSDGTYQYTLPQGGVIGSSGVSPSLYAVATISGSWAVPANTVTQIITSVPSVYTVTVTNPTTGLAASTAETEQSYRSRVLQAGLAASQGMARYLYTLLQNVSGVQSRLVAVIQNATNSQWEIICGGGDQYQVANAIYTALFDINELTGSVMAVSGITNANPGVVTTTLNHGFSNGQVIQINGVVGMSGINGVNLTITVITQTTFSIGINTTSSGAYVSGGVVTPNYRNITSSILDYPNTYQITFVNPPQQTVAMTVTWNTIETNYVNPTAVTQLANPALVSYINSIQVGQPINLFELQATFQTAVASLIPAQLLTRMVFAVSINGIGVSPTSGTGIIAGDPESYFYTSTASITINQG